MTKHHNPFRYHTPLLCYPHNKDLTAATILEIGPGRGDFLFELAKRHSDTIIAAIEIKKKRFYKLIKRIERYNLPNIRLLLGDARVALPCLFHSKQLETIYTLFSDPWPKKRHAKHRLFQSWFIHDLYRTLKPTGELILAHDNTEYLNASRTVLLGHPGFRRGSAKAEPLPFQTFYAEKWLQQGRSLEAFRVRKQALSRLQEIQMAIQSGWWRSWWGKRISSLSVS